MPRDSETSPLIELRLLGALASFIETGEGLAETAALTELFRASQPTDVTGWVRHCAAGKILGEVVSPPTLPVTGDGAEQLFARTANAWMAWAMGDRVKAEKILRDAEPARGGGEIHLMALGFWCRAVGALIREDSHEAQRYFKRSMEVSAQFGTESSIAIQWAYVGSFFSHGGSTS